MAPAPVMLECGVNWRNRWTFWGFAITVLAIVSVPSVEWVSTLRDYARFAEGWQPQPLRPSRTTFTPREGRGVPDAEPDMVSVEFRHKAPRAQSVELIGDFNAWTPGLLKMRRNPNGTWSIVVPVPPGRCRYLYWVDGGPQLDTETPTEPGPRGLTVSVRMVK